MSWTVQNIIIALNERNNKREYGTSRLITIKTGFAARRIPYLLFLIYADDAIDYDA